MQKFTRRNAIGALNASPLEARRIMDGYQQALAENNRNAILVNGKPIWFFSQQQTTKVCTCRAHRQSLFSPRTENKPYKAPPTNLPNASLSQPAPQRFSADSEDDTFYVDLELPITQPYPDSKADDASLPTTTPEEQFTFAAPNLGDLALEEVSGESMQKRAFGGSAKCGVCNRTGYSGGYALARHDRKVLDAYAVTTLDGYHVDTGAYPYVFVQDTVNGSVNFDCVIPTYFFRVYFGVYDNCQHENGVVLIDGNPLTRDALIEKRGQRVTVSVTQAKRVTHVVLLFELNPEPIVADLPLDVKQKDYSRFVVQPSQEARLTNDVPKPDISDFLVRLHDGVMWKVADSTTFGIANEQPLGWVVQMDVVQPEHTPYLILTQVTELL